MELTILLPTLNEAINLRKLLPCIHEVMSGVLERGNYEILVVDAHSEDNIKEVTQENDARLLTVQRGYGFAIARGIKESRGKYIVTMDADLSHSPYIIPSLYSHRKDAEILIASRNIKKGFNHTHFSRRILSSILNSVYRIVLDLPIRDMSSGFRLYHRRIFDELAPTEKNYVVLQQILMKAYARGFKIKEIPFHYHPRRHGLSKSKLFEFGKDYLFSLLKFWRLRNSLFCADYEERAFHSRNPLQRYWQRKRYTIICDLAREYDCILDIGCGSSQILEGLPQAVGCDIHLHKLRYKRAPMRKLVEGDAFQLPFKDETFSAVILSQLVEHLPQDRRIFDEAVRVTKTGGYIILGTPDYSTHWKLIEKLYKFFHPRGFEDEHITHYTRKTILEEFNTRGCRLCAQKYILGAELIVKFRKETEETRT